MATLGRPATTGALPSLGDERSYDAWGRVRLGGQTGAPSARYCASLGHVQDDESGLVYMRARYYEASTGRFVSEDPARDGANWFAYCKNDPVNASDRTGKVAESLLFAGLANWEAGLAMSSFARLLGPTLIAQLAFLVGIGIANHGTNLTAGYMALNAMTAGYAALGGAPSSGGLAQQVQGFYQAYAGFLELALYVIINEVV